MTIPTTPPNSANTSPLPPVRYCLRCREPLKVNPYDADSPRCSRCKLPFDPANAQTYSQYSAAEAGIHWMTGLLLAILTGIVTYTVVRLTGVMGDALFFAVPISVGLVLGYTTRPSIWFTLLLSICAVTAITSTIIFMNLAGIFCGVMLGVIFLPPLVIGAIIGWFVRRCFYQAYWSRKRYVFLLFFSGLPLGTEAVENQFPMEHEVAEVSTSITVSVQADKAWNSILFYEQVEHAPPWLLTMSLPRPLWAEGSKAAVGNLQRCVYNKGYILKRITHRVEQRLLAFDVVEQHLHFEHDVRLLDGSFIVEPMADGRTRIVLTTRYVRLLRPAWLWEPMEGAIIHALHDHVLEGMRRHMGAADERKVKEQPLPPAKPIA